MMDRERKEKKRQEALEATWRSYHKAMENAFALQERTLELARSLLEGPAEAWRTRAESNRATLDTLTKQSRRQQEALKSLIRESTNAYMDLLQAPLSYYQEVMEAMTASWTGPGDGPGSRGNDSLPVENYDSSSVREVSDKLDSLSIEEIKQLRAYELEHKNRQTLMDRFDQRIEAG